MSAEQPAAPAGPDPLLTKLLEASKAAKAVAKAGENKAQKYNYARAEDVIAEARSALHKAGLVALIDYKPEGSREITSGSGTAGLLVRVTATLRVLDPGSGLGLTVTGAGTGTDYPGDKAIYKAMTGAAKYLYASALGIPFGDDPESGEHVDRRGSAPASSSRPAGPPKGFSGPEQRGAFRQALDGAVRSDAEMLAVETAVDKAMTAAQIDNAGNQLLNDRFRLNAIQRLRELAGLEPLDLSEPDTRDLPDAPADDAGGPFDDPDPDLFSAAPTESDPSL